MAGVNDLPPSDLPPDNPPNDPPNDPPTRGRQSRPVCEGCGCTLTPQGEIIKLGDTFKANRKLQDKIDELTDELTVTRRELATARGEVERLSKPAERKRFLV